MKVTVRCRIRMFFLLVSIAQSAGARGDTAEIVRFMKEYPAASARFLEQRAPLRGSGLLTMTIDSAVIPQRVLFAIDHANKATVRSPKSRDGSDAPELVYRTGPDGSFSVRRREAGGSYTIEAIGDGGQGLTPTDRFREVAGRFISAPFAILGRPLSEIMAHPSFKIISARRFLTDGQEVVEVGYQYKPSAIQIADLVELLPEKSWAIRRCERREGIPGTLRFISQVEYEGVRDGLPVPRRATHANPPKQSVEFVFEEVSREKTPDGEFSLTSFGLPDLTARVEDQSRGSLLFGILGAAVLALAGSLALKCIGRRLEASQSRMS